VNEQTNGERGHRTMGGLRGSPPPRVITGGEGALEIQIGGRPRSKTEDEKYLWGCTVWGGNVKRKRPSVGSLSIWFDSSSCLTFAPLKTIPMSNGKLEKS